MEKSASPSSHVKDKEKKKMSKKNNNQSEKAEMETSCLSLMNDDLLQNILSRLPAKSFSFASCVSRSWNGTCSRILSRPKMLSAFSVNPDKRRATEEVLDEVLSEPIRPDFAIANIMGIVNLPETFKLIEERLGPRVPIIVSRVGGIIGTEARIDEFREVKWDASVDDETSSPSSNAECGVLLTVGYVPGLKVDVIPLVQADKEPEAKMGNKFVKIIREYVATISDHAAPVGIILFGDEGCDLKPIIEKLDYAMPMETVILGDESGQCLSRSVNESRNACFYGNVLGYRKVATGLVFVKDKNKPHYIGEIKFHTALSSGVLAIGPRYKAASVKGSDHGRFTFLTARREGQPEILDGQQIVDDINNVLEPHVECAYIGVTKRRNCSVGFEKPKLMTYLTFHEVFGGDEHFLEVEGAGIRTGDYFQFYYSDPNTALKSVGNVSSELRNLKTKWNSTGEKTEAFGGFIFSCYRRGEPFFGRSNIDSSPLLENFPGLPLGGIFCSGEIGRNSACLSEENEEENDRKRGPSRLRQCLHVYSTVYLVMSYT